MVVENGYYKNYEVLISMIKSTDLYSVCFKFAIRLFLIGFELIDHHKEEYNEEQACE